MCVKRIGGAAKLNQHMVGVGERRIGKDTTAVAEFIIKASINLTKPRRKDSLLKGKIQLFITLTMLNTLRFLQSYGREFSIIIDANEGIMVKGEKFSSQLSELFQPQVVDQKT